MTAPAVARGRCLPRRADAQPPPALDRRRRRSPPLRALVAARARGPAGGRRGSSLSGRARHVRRAPRRDAARAPPPAGRRPRHARAARAPTRPIASCARRSRWRRRCWCCGSPAPILAARGLRAHPAAWPLVAVVAADDRRLPAAAAVGAGDHPLPDAAVPAARRPRRVGRWPRASPRGGPGCSCSRCARCSSRAATRLLAEWRAADRTAAPFLLPDLGPVRAPARGPRRAARVRVLRARVPPHLRDRRARDRVAALERALPAPPAAVPRRGALRQRRGLGPDAGSAVGPAAPRELEEALARAGGHVDARRGGRGRGVFALRAAVRTRRARRWPRPGRPATPIPRRGRPRIP